MRGLFLAAGKAATPSHFTTGTVVDNSEHSPITSRVGAGLPEGYCPLEDIPLYPVIHHPQGGGQDGGNSVFSFVCEGVPESVISMCVPKR